MSGGGAAARGADDLTVVVSGRTQFRSEDRDGGRMYGGVVCGGGEGVCWIFGGRGEEGIIRVGIRG